MRKFKILSLLLPTSVLAVSIVPTLTSCKTKQSLTLVTTQNEWTNPTDNQITIEFKLKKELSSDLELYGPTSSGSIGGTVYFKGDATWVVTGTKAVATLQFESHSGNAYISREKLTFHIRNKTTKQDVSTATINNFKVSWTN